MTSSTARRIAAQGEPQKGKLVGIIIGALLQLAISWALIITAVVQAFQHAWLPAIFFAILWNGWNRNTQEYYKNRADRIAERAVANIATK